MIYFLPKTKLGRWALGLAALWPVLTILGTFVVNSVYPGVDAGNGIIDDLRVRPLLAITMLSGIISGAVSLPLNLVAIFKKGERSILSFLATLLGIFLALLLVGEIFVEH